MKWRFSDRGQSREARHDTPDDEQQRTCLHPCGPPRTGKARLRPQLRAQDRGGISRSDHARAGGVHRRTRHRLPGNGVGSGSALHPASRRAQGLHQGARRAHAGLCRLCRKPAVHHARQSCGKRPRLPVPARLRPASDGSRSGAARAWSKTTRPCSSGWSTPATGHRPERAILFTVEAWDVNCSQHITARFSESEIADATVVLRNRIAELEAENARLRAASTPAAHAPLASE